MCNDSKTSDTITGGYFSDQLDHYKHHKTDSVPLSQKFINTLKCFRGENHYPNYYYNNYLDSQAVYFNCNNLCGIIIIIIIRLLLKIYSAQNRLIYNFKCLENFVSENYTSSHRTSYLVLVQEPA